MNCLLQPDLGRIAAIFQKENPKDGENLGAILKGDAWNLCYVPVIGSTTIQHIAHHKLFLHKATPSL